MALLRSLGGLWLLGESILTFLRWLIDPNSVGALSVWHSCGNTVAPCNWLGGASLVWHCCVGMMALPLERSDFGISAWS